MADLGTHRHFRRRAFRETWTFFLTTLKKRN